ncbi:MAG: 30S ribosomal protein S12 methylthiotransferase RimO [Peptostreptococcaceae bacterium]|nr:30S ribosomal protein S12 methylthiotransferase RimO [Peptostreptococcaceae bacterium]
MKIYIETLGCPKNVNDSEMAAGILEKSGHEIMNNPDHAEVIIVNTCGFINDAKKESIGKIFEMSELKSKEGMLVVSGCLSQRYGDDLYKDMPEVDLFIGVNEYEKLPGLIEFHTKGKRTKEIGMNENEYKELKYRKKLANGTTSTIKISEGCDNVCAYCVIPQIRGSYRSRKMEAIIDEAELLANDGCKELILIAQDVTTYGIDLYDGFRLPELLRELCKIEKIQWIRLMYCYEDRITDELIRVIKEEDKICNYLDIPLQHASNTILKSMNRRSTNTSIRDTIGKLRKEIPDIHIRTTFITGFPGETKEDFDELYEFVKTMKFNRLGVFAYSKEENTPAAKMKKQVRNDIKEKRKDALMRLQLEISLNQNMEKTGKIFDVIVDEIDEDGSYIGRTRYDAPEIDNSVIFTSERNLKPGDMTKVKITDAFDYDLVGMEVLI